MPQLELDPESFNPQSRRLCPDGACIGVIGAEGRCKICGIADRSGGPIESQAEVFAEEDQTEQALSEGMDAPGDGSGFDPNRELCTDGSCIGVIGADGRCAECGQRAEA